MQSILVGRLIDGTDAEPRTNVRLFIEDELISDVRDAGAGGGLDDELDLSEFTVLPGFVDCHCHLMFDAGPDHEAVRATLAGDNEYTGVLRALNNAQLALSAGVTTLRDCGGRGFATIALRDAIAQGLALAPRMLASGPAITTTGGHLHYLKMEADSADELLKAGRTVINEGADFIKVCVTGGNMTAGSNPIMPQYGEADLRALVEDSHRLGRPVAGHTHGTPGNRIAVAAGIDYIEHCSWIGLDGRPDYCPETVATMKEKGLWADLTFTNVQRSLLPSGTPDAENSRALRENVAVFHRMLEEGVQCVVSSDAGVKGTRFEEFALSVEVAVVGCRVSPQRAIQLSTRESARALGLDNEVGTVEAGKRADLLAVAGNPLEDIRYLREVRAVLLGGEIVA